MGKKATNIGVKLDDAQLERLDAEIAKWGAFRMNRSAMGRALIEAGLDAIDAGIIQRPLQATQGLLGTKKLEKTESGNKVTEVAKVNGRVA